MTEKLYYADSHISTFKASVISCLEKDGKFEIILDKTAFFPEGGGQASDSGKIDEIDVLDVQERGDDVVHVTGAPLEPGCLVCGEIDWEKRFRRMQNHTGEHIVSGVVHNMFGYDNVGFHMNDEVIVDYDGPISKDDLRRIEYAANEVVMRNAAVRGTFPDADTLKTINYRSKLDLSENVRIVEIEGCDICACCAPHVSQTGEVGLIRLLDVASHRGGVRIRMLCGFDALEDCNKKYENAALISAALSAKQNEIFSAVSRIMNELENSKQTIYELSLQLLQYKIDSLTPTNGNMCIFEPTSDMLVLRKFVNEAMKICGGVCAAFSGSDDEGYRYIIGSKNVDLQKASKEINSAISGKGGGTPEMIQGSAHAKKSEIELFFSRF